MSLPLDNTGQSKVKASDHSAQFEVVSYTQAKIEDVTSTWARRREKMIKYCKEKEWRRENNNEDQGSMVHHFLMLHFLFRNPPQPFFLIFFIVCSGFHTPLCEIKC
jgi:hypothetical protein